MKLKKLEFRDRFDILSEKKLSSGAHVLFTVPALSLSKETRSNGAKPKGPG